MLAIGRIMATILPRHTWDILQMLGVIVVFSLCTIIVGVVLYRRLQKQIDQSNPGDTLSMFDLRRMHRQGQLSDDEFERAKAAVIARCLAQLQSEKTAAGAAASQTSDKHTVDTSDNDDHDK